MMVQARLVIVNMFSKKQKSIMQHQKLDHNVDVIKITNDYNDYNN